MSDLSDYFDRIADEFNGYYTGRRPSFIQEIGHRIFRGPGLRKRFLDTARIIGECKDKKILDVGCGPGVYVQYFAEKGAKVTGIDVSQNMIELAKSNLSKAGVKDIKLIQGNFLEYEFAPNSFDYVLAIGFFDYVSKFERDLYFNKLEKITIKKIIVTFPRRFVFQTPIRKAMFLIKGQPVFFYTKRIVIEIAKRHNLNSNFYNSGPIWTVEFTKKRSLQKSNNGFKSRFQAWYNRKYLTREP